MQFMNVYVRVLKQLRPERNLALTLVGANLALRTGLATLLRSRGGRVYHPRIEFCTDNAAMIAVAGLLRLKRGEGSFDLAITARAQGPLTDLNQDRHTA